MYLCSAGLALLATLLLRRIPPTIEPAIETVPPGPGRLRPLAIVMVGVTLGYSALGALKAFLVAAAPSAHVSQRVAALTLAVGAGLSIALRIALGVRADRRGNDPLGLAAGLLVAGALGYALLSAQEPIAFIVGALFVLVFGWAWIALFGYAVVSRYADAVEPATGVMQTGVFAGGVFGTLAFGLTVELGSFRVAWLGLAFAALVAAFSVARARRVLPRHGDAPAVKAPPQPVAG